MRFAYNFHEWRFANSFYSWLRPSWKLLAKRLTRDSKIVIHGNSCIIIYILTLWGLMNMLSLLLESCWQICISDLNRYCFQYKHIACWVQSYYSSQYFLACIWKYIIMNKLHWNLKPNSKFYSLIFIYIYTKCLLRNTRGLSIWQWVVCTPRWCSLEDTGPSLMAPTEGPLLTDSITSSHIDDSGSNTDHGAATRDRTPAWVAGHKMVDASSNEYSCLHAFW